MLQKFKELVKAMKELADRVEGQPGADLATLARELGEAVEKVTLLVSAQDLSVPAAAAGPAQESSQPAESVTDAPVESAAPVETAAPVEAAAA
ncbi:MAG: hypothetical protein EG825_10330 [Rhodocyclaceae bacterium]|nr:hypothetical protein [Rhodocyclaceae bacterium]